MLICNLLKSRLYIKVIAQPVIFTECTRMSETLQCQIVKISSSTQWIHVSQLLFSNPDCERPFQSSWSSTLQSKSRRAALASSQHDGIFSAELSSFSKPVSAPESDVRNEDRNSGDRETQLRIALHAARTVEGLDKWSSSVYNRK